MIRSPLLHSALLALAIVAVFGQSCTFNFLAWDDKPLIYDNPNIAHPTLPSLQAHWSQPHVSMYIPLVYTTWWSLASIAQISTPDIDTGSNLNPSIFHAANLLVHIVSACLVYQILLLLIDSPWPALAGAMLFAIHPQQAESVCWATGMKEMLCGMLCLAALLQYLRFARAGPPAHAWRYRPSRDKDLPPPASPTERKLHYFAATFFYILALLAMPSAVTLPLVAIALDWLLIRRSIKAAFLAMLPWLALSFVFAIIATHVQPATEIDPSPLWARPLIAADSLAFYLYKLVFPLHLAFDYGRRPQVVLDRHWLYYTWLVPAALAVALWRLRKPTLTAAALVFAIPLLPVLGLTAFVFQFYSTVADRYVYFALLGPALALAWFLSNHRSALPAIVCSLLLALFAVKAFFQAQTWRDTQSLCLNAVQVNPQSFLAYNNLGDDLHHRGVNARALAGVTDDSSAAAAYTQEFHDDVDRAIGYYRQSIAANSVQYLPYENLAKALMLRDRGGEAATVIQNLLDVQRQLPKLHRYGAAQLAFWRGQREYDLGNWSAAFEQLRVAVQLDPTNSIAVMELDSARQKIRN
jgi:protein O-mannosyl-transferase